MVIIIQKSMLSNGKFQDVQERVTHITMAEDIERRIWGQEGG